MSAEDQLPQPTAEQRQACNDWNEAHPPGAPVIFTRADGAELPTATRSRAYVDYDVAAPEATMRPVVLLHAVSGWQPLARVRPDPAREPKPEPAKEA